MGVCPPAATDRNQLKQNKRETLDFVPYLGDSSKSLRLALGLDSGRIEPK
jgi:hypothetical protein